MADSSISQRILVVGVLAVALVATLGGCSQNMTRFDYPVFNLESQSDPTNANHPINGSIRPPSPQP